MKARPDLSVLRNTKAPALLVECCFVDDKDDVQLYDCLRMADAIVYGITGQRVEPAKDSDEDQDVAASGSETAVGDKRLLYRVQVIKQHGAFSIKENAERLQADLKAAGFDAIIVKA